MQAVQRAKSPPITWRANAMFMWAGALFVGSWVYTFVRLEPAIQLHHSGLAFFYGSSFLKGFLGEPGGMAQYLGVFLGQCDARPILGSLIQASAAVGLFILTWLALKEASDRKLHLVALIPPFVLLFLRQQWGYPAYTISLVVLAGLGAALSLKIASRLSFILRMLITWILAVVVFYVAGPIACVLYGVLAAALEFSRTRKPTAMLFLAILLLPVLWSLAGPRPSYWQVPQRVALQIGLIALMAVTPLGVLLSSIFKVEPPPAATVRGDGKKQPKRLQTNLWQKLEPAATAILFIGGCCLVWFSFDRTRSDQARVDYYSAQGQDSRVIQVVTRMAPQEMDGPTELRFHRALYRTGQLGNTLFAFPNLTGLPLFPSMSGDLRNCRPQAESLLELGLVNDAEHLAHEALEYEGERPDLLRLLGRINVLKDRPKAARVFFKNLSHIPFEGPAAREALEKLDGQPFQDLDPGLSAIRPRMLTNDIAHDGLLLEPLLLSLLSCNSSNRMAFDYLITHYLLKLDLKKLAAEMPRLEEFGAAEIPRHWEEGLLISEALTGKKAHLSRLKIRDSTRAQFDLFTRVLDQDTKAKRNLLNATAQFRGTYWYYYVSQQARDKAESN